jgi:hypothetical protein
MVVMSDESESAASLVLMRQRARWWTHMIVGERPLGEQSKRRGSRRTEGRTMVTLDQCGKWLRFCGEMMTDEDEVGLWTRAVRRGAQKRRIHAGEANAPATLGGVCCLLSTGKDFLTI